MPKNTKESKSNPIREQIAEAIVRAKRVLSNAQEELDEAGEERKELTPDMVDMLREGIMGIYPESDEEQVEAVMQLIVETIAEAQPETDVEEEMAMGEDEEEEKAENSDDEEIEKENKALVDITKEVTELAKGYNELISDVSGVLEIAMKTVELAKAKVEKDNDFDKRLADIEKKHKQRPRRASQAEETKLNPESELGQTVEKQLFTPPKGYEDMFATKNGGS